MAKSIETLLKEIAEFNSKLGALPSAKVVRWVTRETDKRWAQIEKLKKGEDHDA